jgi:hypothetical protein
LDIICSSKLAPRVGFETQIYHGKTAAGDIKVAEQDLRQMGFDDVPQADKEEAPVPSPSASKVTTIR